ncbi:MAG TPA: DinB family protein [Gemmatimonadaceae bacterium]|nr:DinB family protein [Gemmatimonadaceae bacterium]
MSLRATLRDHLLTIWAGEPWYGSPSKKILEDVTAAEASAHPLAGAQSIWEATLHMVAWTEEVASRLRGNAAKMPERGDWPAVTATSAEAWTATTDALRAARYALLDVVDKSHEEDFYLQVPTSPGAPDPKKYTRAETVSGLAEHDVYHLGQIAMLKKALRAKPAN